jgi:imidazole glycerol phosphate synthase glutamine amidotransferase subunit
MDVVIIDSGGANLASLVYALQRLGAKAVVSDEAAIIQAAPRVLLPGVGSAGNAMARLRAKGLHEVIPQLTQPVLGICLGMQLMCAHSEENNTHCLGIFEEKVKKFQVKKSFDFQMLTNSQIVLNDKLKIDSYPTTLLNNKDGIVKEVMFFEKDIFEKIDNFINTNLIK